MKNFKALATKIFDFFEIYISTAAFIILFISYVVLITYRYIFHASMAWLFELNVIAFVWCGILAASYGSRAGTSIVFTVVYDLFSEKLKLIVRLIGNLFVFIMFFVTLPYAYNAVAFMSNSMTPIMKIPFSIIYSPFVIFMVLTVIHNAALTVKDMKLGIKMLKGEHK